MPYRRTGVLLGPLVWLAVAGAAGGCRTRTEASHRPAGAVDDAAGMVAGGAEGNADAAAALEGVRLRVRPAPQHPVPAGTFDGRIRYLGFDLAFEQPAGDTREMTVTHYLECLAPLDEEYTQFVHVEALLPGGNPVRLRDDHRPAGGRYPMREWRPGDFIADRHRMPVPPAPAGAKVSFQMWVGFFRGAQRMPLQAAEGYPLAPGQGADDRLFVGMIPAAAAAEPAPPDS